MERLKRSFPGVSAALGRAVYGPMRTSFDGSVGVFASSVEKTPSDCVAALSDKWAEARKIMTETRALSPAITRSVNVCLSAMIPYLIDETTPGSISSCVDYFLEEDVLESIYTWSAGFSSDELKRIQLRMYEILVDKSPQPLLIHEQVLRPLKCLLHSCSGCRERDGSASEVDTALVRLLVILCEAVAKDHSMLGLFFAESVNETLHSRFMLFSFLLPYLHDEKALGNLARGGLLILLGLSTEHPKLLRFVTEESNFAAILCGGLSGLYSSLPSSLFTLLGDDWDRLDQVAWKGIPAIVNFMESFAFCNSIIKVSLPGLTQQLLQLFHDSFLMQIIGQALRQPNHNGRVASTAYFNLLLEETSEPLLLREFVYFISKGMLDGRLVLESLTKQFTIDSNKQLCSVTLSLFVTLLQLGSEEVMMELALRYLLTQQHMKTNQQQLGSIDMTNDIPGRLLSLIPSVCLKSEYLYLIQLNEDQMASSSPSISPSSSTRSSPGPSPHHSPTFKQRTSKLHFQELDTSLTPAERNYLKYLVDAKQSIRHCAQNCLLWSRVYDATQWSITKPRVNDISAGASELPPSAVFLSILISKLNDLLSYPLPVSLLLTKVVSHLCRYPQPLLTSFLLNPNLVLRQGAPNLVQVLTNIKYQIDELAEQNENFEVALVRARKTLISRQLDNEPSRQWNFRDLTMAMRARAYPSVRGGLISRKGEAKQGKTKIPATKLFAIVVFHEFLKELASIAQEHAVGF